jgi:hypothetical protein
MRSRRPGCGTTDFTKLQQRGSNGTGDTSEPEEAHFRPKDNHWKSDEDHSEPAGDPEESEEDPQESGEDSQEVT